MNMVLNIALLSLCTASCAKDRHSTLHLSFSLVSIVDLDLQVTSVLSPSESMAHENVAVQKQFKSPMALKLKGEIE
jgi:hypothetical protein